MLTQKNITPSSVAARYRKAEIMVEGFVPSSKAQDRFDIAPSHKIVADYLRERGFEVSGCADYQAGVDFHGGDLSGAPWNECQFDVFTNEKNLLQARLSNVLRLLIDATEFSARVVIATYKDILDNSLVYTKGTIEPQAIISILDKVAGAERLEVSYRLREIEGSYRI